MTDSDKIKQFAREIKEARERATQGWWTAVDHCDYNKELGDCYGYKFHSADNNHIDQAEDNVKSIVMSANNINQLCDMLLEAVEALEFCKSMVIRPRDVTHEELIDSCDHADEKIRETISKLAEGLK